MYFVTGGSGFIGSAVVRELVKAGEGVIVFSRSGNTERLKGIAGNIVVARGDVADAASLQAALSGRRVECIIHLAFDVDILQLERQPGEGIESNCRGLINILEAARSLGVKRVVWSSSAAVYGDQKCYAQLPVDEEAPLFPLNVYGAYKAFAEWMGHHYHHNLGVANISLRPTIVFGSGRLYRGASTYAYDLFHGAVTGQAVEIEWGDQLIDWLYVKDLARAIVLASQATNLKHRVFNICGHRATVRQAADIIKGIVPSANFKVLPGQRPMWVPYLATSRAAEELGYKPGYTLEGAFADCLQELKTNCEETK
ncbi:GDP-L-fucose synthase [Moorella thermoacetica]|uniref:GDP-L-fucose synthase n=1 Tax=Neomoorella thermoacetica TaxID=1525 RepID=A0AAC9MTT7_NEOTH|nr:NAD(P)-dependent oxidoreductase [Moorella thermoacetica]AOQ22922.1 UDP-glucose 4-epimerase [Moorella thermoacetica]TYL10549.1 GDP-L-fucose synthase [Moorella thermoacetica]